MKTYSLAPLIFMSVALWYNNTLAGINIETMENSVPQENPYEGLRNMALGTTQKDLQLSLADGKTVVYAVVMDWNMGEGVATTVAYQTGDASMYLSSGGGIIGGGQHE